MNYHFFAFFIRRLSYYAPDSATPAAFAIELT